MRISPLVFIGSFILRLGVIFCTLLLTLDNKKVTLGNASHSVYSHVSGANQSWLFAMSEPVPFSRWLEKSLSNTTLLQTTCHRAELINYKLRT
jgi:hypothetical protein